MGRVDVVIKSIKTLFITSPNEKYIIDEAPPYPRATGSSVQHLLFKSRLETACKGRNHPGSHTSPKDL